MGEKPLCGAGLCHHGPQGVRDSVQSWAGHVERLGFIQRRQIPVSNSKKMQRERTLPNPPLANLGLVREGNVFAAKAHSGVEASYS